MEKIKKWLEDNKPTDGYGSGSGSGDGYGYGSGSGDGSGDGSGYGSGYGDGYGYGDGSGSGYGDGYGYGDGSGYGSGDGYGYGDGSGYGSGSGSGYGDGVGSFGGQPVFDVDGVQTIITNVHGSFAQGYILNDDFILTSCFIAKGHGYFAHGKNLKEATAALHSKIFENMDSEEAIAAFMEKFKHDEKYKGSEFFEWHHYLTGSCLMGRESFVKNKGLNIEDYFTVDEFISICEDDYGSEIIKKLKKCWNTKK